MNFLNNFNTSILDFISTLPFFLKYFLVFFFAFVEGIPIIGSFSPGGSIVILSGSIAKIQNLSFSLILIFVVIGGFLGDMIGFFIGRKLKHKKWVQKLINHKNHQSYWDAFDRHIFLISVFGKLLPIIRSVPAVIYGARNHNKKKYIIYSFLGSIVWAFGAVYLGKVLANIFKENILYIAFFIIGFIVLIFLIKIIIKIFKK